MKSRRVIKSRWARGIAKQVHLTDIWPVLLHSSVTSQVLIIRNFLMLLCRFPKCLNRTPTTNRNNRTCNFWASFCWFFKLLSQSRSKAPHAQLFERLFVGLQIPLGQLRANNCMYNLFTSFLWFSKLLSQSKSENPHAELETCWTRRDFSGLKLHCFEWLYNFFKVSLHFHCG